MFNSKLCGKTVWDLFAMYKGSHFLQILYTESKKNSYLTF